MSQCIHTSKTVNRILHTRVAWAPSRDAMDRALVKVLVISRWGLNLCATRLEFPLSADLLHRSFSDVSNVRASSIETVFFTFVAVSSWLCRCKTSFHIYFETAELLEDMMAGKALLWFSWFFLLCRSNLKSLPLPMPLTNSTS